MSASIERPTFLDCPVCSIVVAYLEDVSPGINWTANSIVGDANRSSMRSWHGAGHPGHETDARPYAQGYEDGRLAVERETLQTADELAAEISKSRNVRVGIAARRAAIVKAGGPDAWGRGLSSPLKEDPTLPEQVLELRRTHHSWTEIARELRLGRTTVRDYHRQALAKAKKAPVDARSGDAV